MNKQISRFIYRIIKRLLDVSFALIGLIITLPLMLLVGLFIKLESDGPVFFKQLRTGKDGKNFYIYKFRSMTVDNDIYNFKSENKITKIGKFIRKTSIDELPQFINILKGEMSFIGPRPWIVDYYENFTDDQKRRVAVLPGITGLAQAAGRNNISVLDKINYDLEYVDNYSLKMDIKVIFLTIKTVISKSGAELSKIGIKDEIKELNDHYLSITSEIPVVEVTDLEQYMI